MHKEHGTSQQVVFVSVAFGDKRYLEQQERLKHSIKLIYPDAPLYFWTNEMPPGARSMSDSLYGFKPHAVRFAYDQGYTKIMFFDPAIILMKPIDFYQEKVKEYGVCCARDDNKLSPFCSDKALSAFDLDREKIKDWHLVGGSFYYFDFTIQLCKEIFHLWISSEKAKLFGSQQEQASGKLQGHRNDEAMMALALYMSGSKPMSDDVRYNCENKEVEILAKAHFK
jgi:hypothetical protein